MSTKDFDLGEELVFHVCDDRFWGLEWVTNRMTDDLQYQKQRVLMENFSMPDGFSLEEVPDSSGRPGWFMVVCGFDRRKDFEKGIEFVRNYRDYAQKYPTINDAEFTLSFQVNDTGAAPDWKLIGRSYSFHFSAGTKDEEVREKLRDVSDDYLMDCIECGNLDRMDEYNTVERSAVIDADPNNTEIRRLGEETAAYPGYAYDYGDFYRSLVVEGNSVRIRGKAREFSRLVRIYETRLKELDKELDDYDLSYGFVYNNLHRVYQGITLRIGSDVPREKTESIADKAVGLATLCQVLNSGKEYEWTLEVSFAKRKDGGDWETVLSYELPRDTIDYEKVKRSY